MKNARQTQVVLNEDGTHAEVINIAIEAHRLRLTGMSWADVAQTCGYGKASVAQNAVHRMLVRAAVELDAKRRAAQLMLEVQRLDRLQQAYWDTALDGNVFAAQLVLKIINDRAKLLRLSEPEVAAAAPAATLLVAGSQEDYVNKLKNIVEISRAIESGAAG